MAIFDVLYPYANWRSSDIVSPVVRSEGYDVVTHANRLRPAAEAIAAMQSGVIEMPDAMIVSSRLKGLVEYMNHPSTITHEVTAAKRKLFGGTKQVRRTVETVLLPLPVEFDTTTTTSDINDTVLPASWGSPIKLHQVPGRAAALSQHLEFSGHAAYVISHLTRLLLGEDVKVVVASRDSAMPMYRLPIDAFVHRGPIDAEDTLRSTLRQLLAGDTPQ